MADQGEGLSEAAKSTVRALMRPVLGLPEGDEHLVAHAVARLDAYLSTIPETEATDQLRMAFFLLRMKCVFEYEGRPPERLAPYELERFVRDLYSSEGTLGACLYEPVGILADITLRDIAKTLREMLTLAYYSNPETYAFTHYSPLWEREDIWQREDVAASLVRYPEARPAPRTWEIDRESVEARHRFEGPSGGDWFSGNGRAKVAIIGSGAGGAVVAKELAEAGYDVAVFEAGPRIPHHEYPIDTLEGMSLLFERGLLTTSKDVDMHLLRGRVVGGGTVLTSGMSIKMYDSTRNRWCAKDECNTGLECGELDAAFAEVADYIKLHELDESVTTDPGEIWKDGALRINKVEGKVIYDFRRPLVNTMTKDRLNPRLETIERIVGTRCVGCGMCNYGCRFGHKMSVDLTYLHDAIKAGARVHANAPVDYMLADHDDGVLTVTKLVVGRDKKTKIPVDHVVLSAGAVGTPALLLRSAREDSDFRELPGFGWDGRAEVRVGRGFGFNYGTPVVARFKDAPKRPGDLGIQINYWGHVSGDERFVLENSYIPPGLVANTVPGVGPDHREWMAAYKRLGFAVNTIGSPMHGIIQGDRDVYYRIGTDAELDLFRESLSMVVRQYLLAGAEVVGLGGVRGYDDRDNWFTQRDANLREDQLKWKMDEIIQRPENLMVTSAHPQGGMRMCVDEEKGVVGRDFRVHGSANLFVCDASLFPSTITVNPQWTVMALATIGGRRIRGVLDQAAPA